MDKFIKASPLLTAVLIFLGYWNLHYYYKYFDIQIYDFINASEVIVSFFPIALDVFICGAIFLLFIGLAFIQPEESEFEKERNEEIKIIKGIKLLFKKETYKGNKWYNNIIHFTNISYIILGKILFLLLFIFTIYKSFIVLKYENKDLDKYYYMVIVDIVILFFIINNSIDKKLINDVYKRYKKDIRKIKLVIEFVILFFIINTLSNYKEATKILNKKPEYNISFIYKDSIYKSDSILVYVGKT